MKKRNKLTLCCVSALLSATWFAFPVMQSHAAEPAQKNTVVVVADRSQAMANFNPQHVSIIGTKEIEDKAAKSLEDVIFSQSGVSRTVDAMGQIGISIRGAEPRHTLMLFNGVPLVGNAAKFTGTNDEATRIGLDNVQKIEITEGASSARYGAGAIGGVVNVKVKPPQDKSQVQFNGEVALHSNDKTMESNNIPKNFFLRVDSGKVGAAKTDFFLNKREILPVYRSGMGYSTSNKNWYYDFKPTLRFFGTNTNLGAQGEVDINKNLTLSLMGMKESENLKRLTKFLPPDLAINHDGKKSYLAPFEPITIYTRNITRDTLNLGLKGKSSRVNWNVDVNYGKYEEVDLKTSRYGVGRTDTGYSGRDALYAVDTSKTKRSSVDGTVSYAASDAHLLTAGVGYSHEVAEGTRFKDAPEKWTEQINPINFDKDMTTFEAEHEPGHGWMSFVHNYYFVRTKDGYVWDKNAEYIGPEPLPISFTDTVTHYTNLMKAFAGMSLTEEEQKEQQAYIEKASKLSEEMIKQNPFLKKLQDEGNLTSWYHDHVSLYTSKDAGNPFDDMVFFYYFKGMADNAMMRFLTQGNPVPKEPVKYNGYSFGEGYDLRNNQLAIGRAKEDKKYVFLQDDWQINDNTTITPILRYDHSSNFGGHLSASLGMTHNIKGNTHSRIKAVVGTGYNEPGLGELYYNWEMFGAVFNQPGWYWLGNANLKPETSVNFDLSYEKETAKSTHKLSLFHNRIDNYLTYYFTGQLLSFSSLTNPGGIGYTNINYNGTPITKDQFSAEDGTKIEFGLTDRIYSFKNIGRADITGLTYDYTRKLNDNWNIKFGYTWLHTINKSDPNMPKQLLDRPVHKLDLTLQYNNPHSHITATLWGDYLAGLLDGNSVIGLKAFLEKDDNGYYKRREGKIDYAKKTYSIWNFNIQKKLNASSTAYIGINNLLNYRDDERAMQDRTYHLGIRINSDLEVNDAAYQNAEAALQQDFSKRKAGSTIFYGSLGARFNSHGGDNLANVVRTANNQVEENAARVLVNRSGVDDRAVMTLGVDTKITPTLSLTVEGTTNVDQPVYDLSAHKKDVTLTKAALTKHGKNTNYTVGRVHAKLGATGYWFNKNFDGIKMMHQSGKTNITAGFGDFSHSTGIKDTAYTFGNHRSFLRAPTRVELAKWLTDELNKASKLGDPTMVDGKLQAGNHEAAVKAKIALLSKFYEYGKNSHFLGKEKIYSNVAGYWSLQKGSNLVREGMLDSSLPIYAKVNVNNKPEVIEFKKLVDYLRPGAIEEYHLIKNAKAKFDTITENVYDAWDAAEAGMADIIAKTDAKADTYKGTPYESLANRNAGIVASEFGIQDASASSNGSGYFSDAGVGAEDTTGAPPHFEKDHPDSVKFIYKFNSKEDSPLVPEFTGTNDGIAFSEFKDTDKVYNKIKEMADEDLTLYIDKINSVAPNLHLSLVNKDGSPLSGTEKDKLMYMLADYSTGKNVTYRLGRSNARNSFGYSPYFYRDLIDRLWFIGNDNPIPNFAPLHKVEDGILVNIDQIPSLKMAGYVAIDHAMTNNWHVQGWYLHSFSKNNVYGKNLSRGDVFSLSTTYDIGHMRVALEGGVNFSQTGKYHYGARNNHGEYVNGGTSPKYWVFRMSAGKVDPQVKGSWSAFADYKSFDHGSFYGGNGTMAVPDRYLDGIRSYTVGGSFVPMKNFVIDAFYTFGAKGIQKRANLYGMEDFTLANYSRVQVSYHF